MIKTKPSELKLALTLSNGQCFNWKKSQKDDEWIGVINKNVVALKNEADKDGIKFKQLAGNGEFHDLKKEIEDYFQLNVSMNDLRNQWVKKKKSDRRFAEIANCMKGMRIVRQDPTECLFSFICSSNNNISRITLMLDRLRSNYGEELYKHETLGSIHAFPEVDRLAQVTETELRDLGFGYRAKFVTSTAKTLLALGGTHYLKGLRGSSNDKLREALTTFQGVGPKVADCVALFSLDATSIVPVDTHVWRIACRDYDDKKGTLKNAKSVTKKLYEHVGNVFVDRFGEYAGTSPVHN